MGDPLRAGQLTGPVPGGFLGLDLGWTTGATGVAVLDDTGRLVASGRVRTDEEILGWVAAHAPSPRVVGVDAPLVVPNETGQRGAERLITSAFGRYGAATHVTNRGRYDGADPRAMRLARRLGWSVDPAAEPGRGTLCVEVYPHAALVGLFELPYRLAYKKGRRDERLPGFRALVRLLEGLPELGLAGQTRWAQLCASVADPGPGDLDRVEDELDAIVCAHVAWRWEHRRASLHVYGSLAEGFIVAPTPPAHPAVRPR